MFNRYRVAIPPALTEVKPRNWARPAKAFATTVVIWNACNAMSEQIILQAAVFGASFLQAATGIGFGIIAGPIILIVMGDGAAIQVSILLSFLNAIVLTPGVFRYVDRTFLKWLLAGSIVGAPLGALTFSLIGLTTLKILAGVAVAFMAVMASGRLSFSRLQADTSHAPAVPGLVGIVSGAMNAALAMPGPVVAAFMSAARSGKAATRATILVLFAITYPIAFAFQLLIVGKADTALTLSLVLAPATVAGLIAGRWATGLISEDQFRIIVVAILIATACALLVSIF